MGREEKYSLAESNSYVFRFRSYQLLHSGTIMVIRNHGAEEGVGDRSYRVSHKSRPIVKYLKMVFSSILPSDFWCQNIVDVLYENKLLSLSSKL